MKPPVALSKKKSKKLRLFLKAIFGKGGHSPCF